MPLSPRRWLTATAELHALREERDLLREERDAALRRAETAEERLRAVGVAKVPERRCEGLRHVTAWRSKTYAARRS